MEATPSNLRGNGNGNGNGYGGRGRICDAGSGSSGAAECRFENAYDGEGVGVSREGLLWSLGTGKQHAYASIVSVFT